MYLESLTHDRSCFVTLTYADEHLPEGNTVVPEDVQKWLKRFRKRIDPHKVRYFAVGEYGDRTERPHYHLALFGVGEEMKNVVLETWGKGHTLTAEFNQYTARYIAGYVIKKRTNSNDKWLNGRHPEFARMSNRPGIGAHAMSAIANSLCTDFGMDLLSETGDVPNELMIGKQKVPLGAYLKKVLRREIGMPENWNQNAKDKISEEVSAVTNALVKKDLEKGGLGNSSELIAEQNKGKHASIEARSKLQWKRTL